MDALSNGPIAGVVNFVLNPHYEGVKVDANYGFYNHHNNDSFSLTALQNFGANLPPALKARVLSVQAMIMTGFLLFVLVTLLMPRGVVGLVEGLLARMGRGRS